MGLCWLCWLWAVFPHSETERCLLAAAVAVEIAAETDQVKSIHALGVAWPSLRLIPDDKVESRGLQLCVWLGAARQAVQIAELWRCWMVCERRR